jgi:hypothetical protein
MRHAGPAALDRLDALCGSLREIDALQERSRGVFYLRSKAFLHFHEDPAGLFADVRIDGPDFERMEVTSARQQQALLTRVRAAVGASATRSSGG